jgi:hypothetical protein
MENNIYPHDLYKSPGCNFSSVPYGTYQSVTVYDAQGRQKRLDQGYSLTPQEAIEKSGITKKIKGKKPLKPNLMEFKYEADEKREASQERQEVPQEVLELEQVSDAQEEVQPLDQEQKQVKRQRRD